MSVKITVKDADCDMEASKFFGEILLPEEWLEKNVFAPEELYFCQINLQEVYEAVGKTLLPETGMLYFFIDYTRKKPEAVVRYYDGEPDAYTMFNEDWETDYDVYTEWPMFFELADGGAALLCKDEKVSDDEIALLKYDPKSLGIDFLHESEKCLYFIISVNDLKNADFGGVKLLFA